MTIPIDEDIDMRDARAGAVLHARLLVVFWRHRAVEGSIHRADGTRVPYPLNSLTGNLGCRRIHSHPGRCLHQFLLGFPYYFNIEIAQHYCVVAAVQTGISYGRFFVVRSSDYNLIQMSFENPRHCGPRSGRECSCCHRTWASAEARTRRPVSL